MDKVGNFIDEIKIFCRSGKGGKGTSHFMRTKFNPKAGPDGGNGGRGGHIILKGNKNLWTLLPLRYHKNVFASNGDPGGKNNSSGKDGEDRIIEVPLGTIIRDEESGVLEAEILNHNQEIILMEGGKGGLGNSFFKKATRQTPEYAQPGLSGKEGWKIFELKLLADVGLVGFPNAGKSTLLSSISASKTKIANYPFTTLVPQLGIVHYKEKYSFCMADLPGIIEGAAEGKGLGLRFLRHIERNSLLLFLIPADSENCYKEYKTIIQELKKYNPELLDKDKIVAITKSDILSQVEDINSINKVFPKSIKPLFISSVTRSNLNELVEKIWKKLAD